MGNHPMARHNDGSRILPVRICHCTGVGRSSAVFSQHLVADCFTVRDFIQPFPYLLLERRPSMGQIERYIKTLPVTCKVLPELPDTLIEDFVGSITGTDIIRVIHTDYTAVLFSNLQISDRSFHKMFIGHINHSLYVILNPFSYRLLTAWRNSRDNTPAETASTASMITISGRSSPPSPPANNIGMKPAAIRSTPMITDSMTLVAVSSLFAGFFLFTTGCTLPANIPAGMTASDTRMMNTEE